MSSQEKSFVDLFEHVSVQESLYGISNELNCDNILKDLEKAIKEHMELAVTDDLLETQL